MDLYVSVVFITVERVLRIPVRVFCLPSYRALLYPCTPSFLLLTFSDPFRPLLINSSAMITATITIAITTSRPPTAPPTTGPMLSDPNAIPDCPVAEDVEEELVVLSVDMPGTGSAVLYEVDVGKSASEAVDTVALAVGETVASVEDIVESVIIGKLEDIVESVGSVDEVPV